MADMMQELEKLYAVISSRNGGNDEESYTAKLFAKGTKKIAQKVGEEAVETVIAAVMKDKREVISESADLLFHLLVLWADRDIKPAEVVEELTARKGISGIAEKKSRK